MSEEKWYDSISWYEPLRPVSEAAAPAVKQKKERKTWPMVLAGVLLTLALIVGLSLLFRTGEEDPVQLPTVHFPGASDREDKTQDGADRDSGWDDWRSQRPSDGGKEDKPDYREFFDALYPPSETESVTVGIPRGEAGTDFSLALEPAGRKELTLQALYETCSRSVVGISGFQSGQIGYSWGSGVILTEDGLIITNTHVIEDCDSATVKLYDDTEYDAELIGYDAISDIAVLKIEAEGLPAADFGDSAAIFVGQKVAAIGNPLGENFRMTMTDGIISAISRDINYNGRTMTLMQTNAALNEGNSGGPLFNLYGQVIGITNMKMISSGSSIEGIGFAIPTSTVATVVNGILKDGAVVGRVSIGITIGPIPDSAAEDYDLPAGLYIAGVSRGSDAEAKGLQVGDILLAVNGQPVTETKEVAAIKDQFQIGDELLFKIWRDGEIFEVSVALVDTNDVYG